LAEPASWIALDEAAPDLLLEDEQGARALSSCWSEGPAVLVFLRHFG